MAYTFELDIPTDLVAPHRVIKRPVHESNYGYSQPNVPQALVLHTPEEPQDSYPGTPIWFENPAANASTHYYAHSSGDLYQMVADRDGAWAQGTTAAQAHWKGNASVLPPWNEGVNNNLRALSIEIEGYAHNFSWTPQMRETVIRWIIDRCAAYDIPMNRDYICGHEELATHKRDPGIAYQTFDIDELVAECVARTDNGNEREGVLRDLRMAENAIERAIRYIEGA